MMMKIFDALHSINTGEKNLGHKGNSDTPNTFQ